jgi:hypothetical protein
MLKAQGDDSHGMWRAGALYLAITMVFAYPLTIAPASTSLAVDSDFNLVRWILGWDVHAFLHQPFSIFDANIFAPLPGTLGYAENLIGSALIAAPIVWLTGNLLLALNVVAIVSIPLSGMGVYLLARRVGIAAAGATLAGLFYAFTPPRFFRLEQFQLTTIQWIPFCLAFLHAYLDKGRARDLRFALLFFALQALTAGHGGAFLTFGVIALLVYRFALGQKIQPIKYVKDMGVVGALILLPAVLVFIPYQKARVNMGLERTLEGWFTPIANYVASPSHVDNWIYQRMPDWVFVNAPDAYLFPGYLPLFLILISLFVPKPRLATDTSAADGWWRRLAAIVTLVTVLYAAVGLWATFSPEVRFRVRGVTLFTVGKVWRVWLIVAVLMGIRWWLAKRAPFEPAARIRRGFTGFRDDVARWRQNGAIFYALLAIFCFGLTMGPPYGLWQYVYDWPIMSFIRGATRFVLLELIGVAVLLGFAFERLTGRLSSRARTTLALVIGALCLVEFAGMPLQVHADRGAVPKIDYWLAGRPKPFTVAEVPLAPDMNDMNQVNVRNTRYMLHSTVHWGKTVHGFSGLMPDRHLELYTRLSTFPNEAAFAILAEFNVTYLVVHFDPNEPQERGEWDTKLAPFQRWLKLEHEEVDGRIYSLVRPKG